MEAVDYKRSPLVPNRRLWWGISLPVCTYGHEHCIYLRIIVQGDVQCALCNLKWVIFAVQWPSDKWKIRLSNS